MFVVIFRHGGERYELTFTVNERAIAQYFAFKYGVKVTQFGALISRSAILSKAA